MHLFDWVLLSGVWIGFSAFRGVAPRPQAIWMLLVAGGIGGALLLWRMGPIPAGSWRLWWTLSGLVLVWAALVRVTGQQRARWAETWDALVSALGLGFLTGMWQPLGVGVVAGAILARGLTPLPAGIGPVMETLGGLSLGGVGLRDLAAGVAGIWPPHHLSWLWVTPWLLIGEIHAVVRARRAGISRRAGPEPPRPPRGGFAR